MPRISEMHWGIGLILLICVLSFGLQVPSLGLYWDDYATLHIYQQFGAEELTPWMGGVARPLYGWILTQLWTLIGVDILPWHLINLGTYALTVLLFWGILRLLFPKNPARNTLIALLFAVYPSYHLRPDMMSNNLSISLALLLASFWMSLLAVRRDNLLLAWLGALLVPAYQLIYDQGLPFEMLRPLAMLWVMWMGVFSLRRLALMWLPYPALAIGVFFYRFVLFEPSSTYSDYNTPYYLHSLDGLLLSFKRSVTVPIQMLTWDWFFQPWNLFVDLGNDFDLPGLIMVIFLPFCLLYLWRFQRADVPKTGVVLAVVLLSWMTAFAVLLPVHLVGRLLEPGLNSRWTLFPSLLTALVLGIALPRLLRSAYLGNLLMVILIVTGLATQVAVNQEYIDDWNLRRDLWWQLRWRAPELEPGTVILMNIDADDLAFGRTLPDYEMMAHSNLFYYRDDYPAVVAATPYSIRRQYIAGLPTSGLWSERIIRYWQFDFDEMVVLGYGGGCLTTADPNAQTQLITQPDFVNTSQMHNPDQITNTALQDLQPAIYEDLIGPEPLHGWCYDFQQIQWTAEQRGPEEAARLAQEAINNGSVIGAENSAELVPLVVALNAVGDYDDALYLIRMIVTDDAHSQQVLCERLAGQASIDPDEIEAQMRIVPGC